MRRVSALLVLAFLAALSACGGSRHGVDPYSVRSFDPDKPNLTETPAGTR